MSELTSFASAWRERQREYRELVRSRGDVGKHSFVTAYLEGLELNLSYVGKLMLDLKKREQDCDMGSLQLVRLLYLTQDGPVVAPGFDRELLLAELVNFPFWPSTDEKMRGKESSQLCFWSENHIIMSLGTAHLSRQLLAMDRAKAKVKAAKAAKTSAIETPKVITNDGEEEEEEEEEEEYDNSASTMHGWMALMGGELAAVISDIPGAALEEKLLRHYLQVHTSSAFGGVYEALSHVYLPYTLSALWNLYDFSHDHALRADASTLIDHILQSLLLTTSSTGVSTFTASCRAFSRTRLRTRGHNINQLVRMLTGVSPEPLSMSFLTDFLCTTSWQPRAALLDDFFNFSGRIVLRCSHNSSDVTAVYRSADPELNDFEMTPFIWSAGLVLHPSHAAQTKRFLAKKHLKNNATLSALKFVPQALAGSLATSLSHLSAGQSYCGVTLKVFKTASRSSPPQSASAGAGAVPGGAGSREKQFGGSREKIETDTDTDTYTDTETGRIGRSGTVLQGPGSLGQAILTSFDRWNVQKAGFQQLPWALNLAGVALWSQSGAGSEGVLGFGLTNTHNPSIVQEGGVLLCAYSAPPHLTNTTLTSYVLKFSPDSWLVWPDCLMERCEVYAPAGLGAQAAARAIERDSARRRAAASLWGGMWGGGGGGGDRKSRPGEEGWALPYSWRVGIRRGCYVGALCTAETQQSRRPCEDTNMEVLVADIGDMHVKDAVLSSLPPESRSDNVTANVHASRIFCHRPAHSWIIVVATVAEFPSIIDFYHERCLAIEIQETLPEKSNPLRYACRVSDPVEGILAVEF